MKKDDKVQTNNYESGVQVLDHGYIKLIESWGSDERIIESARMSTDGSFRGWGGMVCYECTLKMAGTVIDFNPNCKKCKGTGKTTGDEKLLRYLYTHKHMSPFEMCGMTLEIQAPIFVFREWHRHRTMSYNELSGRYIQIPDVNYCPTVDRCMPSNSDNKQESSLSSADREEITRDDIEQWLSDLRDLYQRVDDLYREGLDLGIPKEVARVILPVGRYSKMRSTANLRNWLQFLTLRNDQAAQWEIRQYAIHVQEIIKHLFPRTHELFVEGRQ